ncbi:MAG: thioesterase [Rhodobacteraceae bacterium]|jgi:medium-chain acyl-[acyl-carrier-protein] hydrolase|nr:thioesterase [Paracoccaceae bacterium]
MASPWLLEVPKPQARRRLYVFPYLGGNPAAFIDWSRALGPDTALSVVNLPGRGLRLKEPSLTEMRPAALQIAAAVTANAGAADFAFFGHSMGAVLAFEVLRICTMMHLRRPDLMVVSGCRWPGALERDDLHLLDDSAFRSRLNDLGGTPPEVMGNDELMRLLTPMLRADFAMLNGYVYRTMPRLPVPLHVFASQDDLEVPLETLPRWFDESSHPGEMHLFPGGHFFLHEPGLAVPARLRELGA